MDINTKVAIQRGQLPDRFLNQLDHTRSIQENYISGKENAYDIFIPEEDDSTTEVILTVVRKDKR